MEGGTADPEYEVAAPRVAALRCTAGGLRGALPELLALRWARTYGRGALSTFDTLLGDVSSGFVVAVMLVPQGLAYAALAGMPPVYGLYASIAATLLYPLFGSSPTLAVGPVAMVSLLVSSTVSPMAEPGSPRFVELALLLAFLTGVVQLLLGLLRIGGIVNFLSHPVLKGFTNAAAIIIGSSQLGKLLGYKVERSPYVLNVWADALANIDQLHTTTVLLAVENIVLFAGLKWLQGKAARTWPLRAAFFKSLPTALVVVVLNIVLVVTAELEAEGVAIVGHIPSGFAEPVNLFSTQSFVDDVVALSAPAIIISLIGFMESVSVAKAMALRSTDSTPVALSPNQELVAIGVVNLIGSFFQTFPVTGGFSRTSVNAEAGARTPFSSFVSGLLLTAVVLWLTPLFEALPSATLGAMIVVAVAKLIEVHTPIELWRVGARGDFLVWLSAFVLTLLLGIEEGVLLAAGVSLAVVLHRVASPHWAVLGELPLGGDGKVASPSRASGEAQTGDVKLDDLECGAAREEAAQPEDCTTVYRNVARYPQAKLVPGLTILRFDAPLFFANAETFADTALALADDIEKSGSEVAVLLVDCGVIPSIDYSAMHMLEALSGDLKRKGVRLVLTNVRGPVRDALRSVLAVHKSMSAPFVDAAFFPLDVAEAVRRLGRADEVANPEAGSAAEGRDADAPVAEPLSIDAAASSTP